MNKVQNDKRICIVCGTENTALSVTCVSCGAYIQNRVTSLHLFDTLWKLIEAPFEGMQKIIIAGQKNYIYLMQIFFGFAYTALVFWLANIGLIIDNLQVVLVLILLLGPFAGIILITVLSMIATAALRIKNKAASYRDVQSILSYAGFPVVLSFLFVFPGEVGIFGMSLFTNEPSPFIINATVYGIVLAIDALLIVWTIGLLYIGVRVLSGIPRIAVVVAIITIIAGVLPAIAIKSIVSVYGAL